MSLRSFEPLSDARLLEVCAQRSTESQTLDFKQTLPGTSDRDKAEFLKDVCAMANRDGGDLVYGVTEAAGIAGGIAAISAEPADAAKRRLGQVADAGLEPRVTGIEFRAVEVNGGYVLLVRVPASFNGPHRYNLNGVGRFVIRNGTHTVELSYEQLRSAFDRTATLTERARQFRQRRLHAIGARSTWMPIIKGPVCAVHLVPITGMAGNRTVDIPSLYNNYAPLMFSFWNGASRATNLDGLIVYPGVAKGQKEIGAYSQVFRSGALETVRYGGGFADPTSPRIPAATISKFIRDAVDKFLAISRNLGFAGPAIAGAALLTTCDYDFALPPEHFDHGARADRDDIVLPEVWIDAIESAPNIDSVVRPMLDVLWQAFDVERCYHYDTSGNWHDRLG